MKSQLLALVGITTAMSAFASAPDLNIRLNQGNPAIVVVSANVSSNSTWILEGASTPAGPWTELVTLKPDTFQIPVSTAPQFLRLHRGNEVGEAQSVFRKQLGVSLSRKTVKVFPVCPLPPGIWTLQESSDLVHWKDTATFENSGYQKDSSGGPANLNYRLVQR